MSVKFDMNGMDELRAALRNLPAELRDEANDIIFAEAEAAKMELEAAYPIRVTGLHPGPKRLSPWFPPGALKGRISVKRQHGQFSSGAIVKNSAPHAWLFENGTQVRHNALGANRGAMPRPTPPGRVFIPIMIRRRKWMYAKLRELLVSKGLLVSGEA